MEAYTDFADVYDTFMDDTPYEEWFDFLKKLIEEYGISKPVKAKPEAGKDPEARENPEAGEKPEAGENPEAGEDPEARGNLETERNLVLDLGCGTGTLTEMFAGAGYDMIGVDVSEDMLRKALEKAEHSGSGTLYLRQDMRELSLYGTVGTVFCVCDALNYILEEDELRKVFALVNNYLFPGGIFIFDFNTVYKYAEVIGDATIAENRDECSFIWENYYHSREEINEYDVTVFVREKEQYYRRFTETHYQRGYTAEQMARLVRESGMKVELMLDADTREAVTETSERIYILAREQGKGNEGRKGRHRD